MPEITMPKLSDTMEEGTLVRWLKQEGDTVDIGEVIAEVETDKATMEMEAFDEGTLARIDVKEGEKVSVGEVIGFVQADGEEPPEKEEDAKKDEESQEEKKAGKTAEGASDQQKAAADQAPEPAEREETSPKAPESGARAEGDARKIKASPLARKMATNNGLDLRQIEGTGPGGRIIKRDIENALETGIAKEKPAEKKEEVEPAQAPTGVTKTEPSAPGAQDEATPLSSMRKVIADRLIESKTTIPHFYLHIQVNAEPLMKFRAELNTRSQESGGPKFTVNDLLLKATVVAATRVPEVNASFNGTEIVRYGNVNLAVAVDIGDGLITPVIRSAQNATLSAISTQVKDLASRAKEKKLKPEEYQGGTITVSNLGAYGIQYFDAIINPPQSLILSVGAVNKQPVVNENDEIVVGQLMDIGVSCDHRVVDGAIGARFLKELKTLLETPYLILV